MRQLVPSKYQVDNVSVSFVSRPSIVYAQNYPLSEDTWEQLSSAFEKLPNGVELAKEQVSKVLMPGGLPECILEELVFQDDFEKIASDSIHWHLYYSCKFQGNPAFPITLKPHLSLSLEENQGMQQQSFLRTFAAISFDLGDKKYLLTDIALLGKSYTESYVHDMLLSPIRHGSEVEKLNFVPVENAGYLLNALMTVCCKVEAPYLEHLYELRSARDHISQSLPFRNASEQSWRKLHSAADALYRAQQEELIATVGAPKPLYCEFPKP